MDKLLDVVLFNDKHIFYIREQNFTFIIALLKKKSFAALKYLFSLGKVNV